MKKLLVLAIVLLAAGSLSAQDVTAIYNEAGAAYNAKDFAGAAAKFEQVIEQGMDNEDAASQVATAKKTLPTCYFMMGGGAIRTKKYDEALKNFTKSAELAELYGDMSQMAKANGWVAKIYQIQGGEAFNNKDYATAASVFEKGYKADPDNTAMALNLAMSYCEMGEYEKGMDIYEAIAAKTHPKYADDVAKAVHLHLVVAQLFHLPPDTGDDRFLLAALTGVGDHLPQEAVHVGAVALRGFPDLPKIHT